MADIRDRIHASGGCTSQRIFRFRTCVPRIWFLAAVAVLFSIRTASGAGQALWWDERWPYRKIVRVSESGGGAAKLWVYLGDRGREDASDVRVMAEDGQAVPFGILHSTDEGKHLLVFEAAGPGQDYAVYFGNPRAGYVSAQFPRSGLVLETRPAPEGVDRNDWQSVSSALSLQKDIYGLDYWPRVFDGYNPFGPSADYVSIYRGYLECERAGEYKFATVSDRPSFVLINGQLVAEWVGEHNVQKGRRGEHGGAISLSNGLHQFTYVGFGAMRRGRMGAAWTPPGKKWWEIIPEGAFNNPAPAKVLHCEKLGSPVCADFRAEPKAYCESGDARMVAVQFISQGRNPGRVAAYRWQFGDNLSAAEPNPIHVYFAPGVYEVSLMVRDRDGDVESLTQKVKVEPVWGDLDFRARKLTRFFQLTQGYKVEDLPPELLVAAQDFFWNIDRKGKAFRAASALEEHEHELGPRQLYSMAMHLGLYQRDVLADLDAAESYFEAAVSNAHETDRGQLRDARFELAETYLLDMDRPERAIEAFQSFREDFPDADADRRRRALLRIGDVHRNQGRLDKAMEVYLQAEEDEDYRPDKRRDVARGAYTQSIEHYLRVGDAQAAIETVDAWLWHYPTMRTEGEPILLRAKAELLAKDYTRAKRDAELYLRFGKDPNFVPQLHLAAGEACVELGQAGNAADHFRAILDKYPESPAAIEAQVQLEDIGG